MRPAPQVVWQCAKQVGQGALLNQGFAAGDHEALGVAAAREHVLDRLDRDVASVIMLLPVPAISGVAKGARQVAAREPQKRAGRTGAGTFTLDAVEDLGDFQNRFSGRWRGRRRSVHTSILG